MENMRATKSQEEQYMVEVQIFRIYDLVCQLPPHAQSVNFELRRENHIQYLINSLKQLGPNFTILDANRPWLCYWIIHSIALLGDCVDEKLENDVIEFLQRCQDPNGGYGGGPGQAKELDCTKFPLCATIPGQGDIGESMRVGCVSVGTIGTTQMQRLRDDILIDTDTRNTNFVDFAKRAADAMPPNVEAIGRVGREVAERDGMEGLNVRVGEMLEGLGVMSARFHVYDFILSCHYSL